MKAKKTLLAIASLAIVAAVFAVASFISIDEQTDNRLTLGDQVTDAPSQVNVNTQYSYTPDISNSSHPMHVLNNLVLKNLKTGEVSASINYELPS